MRKKTTTKPITIPRLVVGGTHSGAGKTTVSIALMALLGMQKMAVYPYKVGPDYIDPSFHAFVTGMPSCNLDSWLLQESTVQGLFLQHAASWAQHEKAIAIIEGVMGLFDGQGVSSSGSTAHVAAILKAPILLVVDGRGISRSVAALVTGYARFDSQYQVGGVVFSHLSSEKHYTLLERIMQQETDIPCCGFLQKNADIVLHRRHLGLVPQEEVAGLETLVETLAATAAKTLDLKKIIALASTALPLPLLETTPAIQAVQSISARSTDAAICDDTTRQLPEKPLRIGIFRDRAFSFYYQANLMLLEALGAELVFMSAMHDVIFAEGLHGLYIGGGFPEVYAEELSANRGFRQGVLMALENGLPTYAECGGLMYLMDSITTIEKKTFPMTGFFPGTASMSGRLQHFGYVHVAFMNDTVLGPAGTTVQAHEFHHSQVTCGLPPAYHVHKDGASVWTCGFVKKKTLGAYPHIHFYSNPQLAGRFVAECRQFQTKQQEKADSENTRTKEDDLSQGKEMA